MQAVKFGIIGSNVDEIKEFGLEEVSYSPEGKVLDGFDAIHNAFGDGGGIIMQMPMGQFVMIPMLPSTGNQYSCLIVCWEDNLLILSLYVLKLICYPK